MGASPFYSGEVEDSMAISDREYQRLIPKVKSVLKEFLRQEYSNFRNLCEISVAHSAPLRKDAIPYITGSIELPYLF